MSVACAALPGCAPFDEGVAATIHHVDHESFHVLIVECAACQCVQLHDAGTV